ncbi:MAG: corrinoid protein-associated methyltransferase CpaM [Candidatus Heimdallarchaeaceae archaeon]
MSFILMKILESSPYRYDKSIKILTLGKIEKAYDRLVQHVEAGSYVLDIGCGTGILTIKAAKKGAKVFGIDINPEMLEIAEKKSVKEKLEEKVVLKEMGVAELDSLKEGQFDVVMSGLCFSELSEQEILYTLREITRLLKEGGLLLFADEIKSSSFLKRVVNFILKLPLIILTYLFTQTSTRAISKIEEKFKQAGFTILSVQKNKLENFIEIIAQKEKKAK